MVKLEKTRRDFETERVAKEKRDMDAEAEAALAVFDERSAQRKTQFDSINGELTTAKESLEANLNEIKRLEGLIESDPDNAS